MNGIERAYGKNIRRENIGTNTEILKVFFLNGAGKLSKYLTSDCLNLFGFLEITIIITLVIYIVNI